MSVFGENRDSICTEIKENTHTTPSTAPTPPTPAIDVAPVVAAMNEKFEDLKRETSSSLKSFAEAVKVLSGFGVLGGK